jgi:transcriptional regulator with XRE-family HTH domain
VTDNNAMLRELRLKTGASPQVIAAAMGVTTQRVAAIERTPPLRLTSAVLARYLQALGVSMDLTLTDGAAFGVFRTMNGKEIRFDVPAENPSQPRTRLHLTSIQGGRS